MTIRSMTGFAAAEGVAPDGSGWRWEVRSVNGRGFDLRLKLPDGADALEPSLRKTAQAIIRRGSVNAQLRLTQLTADGPTQPDATALKAAAIAVRAAEAAAAAAGLALAPITADALLRLPGVFDRRAGGAAPLSEAVVRAGFEQALAALDAARLAEGQALAETLRGIVDAIETRMAEAAAAHAARLAEAPARLEARLAAVLDARAPVEPDRLAQELALLAIRQDVREELDRLAAHIAAARSLLANDGPAGRQLDFLTQEFNREVNTLCAKSDSLALTETGLAMKVLVDQLREQAQNVE